MNTLLGEIGEHCKSNATFVLHLPFPPSIIAKLDDVVYPRYRLAFKMRKLQHTFMCKFVLVLSSLDI